MAPSDDSASTNNNNPKDQHDSSSSLTPFTVTAPGRLCLFGEHQDYLHLPVIALALPLVCQIRVQPMDAATAAAKGLEKGTIRIRVAPLDNQVWTYAWDNLPPRQGTLRPQKDDDDDVVVTSKPDFALAVLHEALETDGWKLPNHIAAVDCWSTSTLPLQAGVSSSSAFCVAFSLVVAQLCGQATHLVRHPIELAKRAHRAEVTHFGAPGGNMDHVTSAVGGLVRIGAARDPWVVEQLPSTENLGCWVLADSGQMKDTFEHLHRCKDARLALLSAKLGSDWDGPPTSDLTPDESVLWSATLVNRNTERDAAQLMRGHNGPASSELGRLMLRHHEALRDGLHLSTTRLEAMCHAAMEAGACGFKVVASGGGGCGVAWVETREKAAAVQEALQNVGAPRTWIIDQPASGARLMFSP